MINLSVINILRLYSMFLLIFGDVTKNTKAQFEMRINFILLNWHA